MVNLWKMTPTQRFIEYVPIFKLSKIYICITENISYAICISAKSSQDIQDHLSVTEGFIISIAHGVAQDQTMKMQTQYGRTHLILRHCGNKCGPPSAQAVTC
ncbi:hypothetical protein DPMN_016599 [Dreissena polymorpha]|uniref:Uncharacterized protein n=1 Tax=Dreissena polymorpha TaxID=45954 RepID=A0A9D4NDT5_DREPO|nr:hypothetical protein DPMN_016599 [Dreissena polymorpha]